jgi:hypothetical protein
LGGIVLLLFLLIPGSWAFAQSTLTPAPVTGLISIVVTPANLSIASGETQQFTATGHFRGGSRQNLTAWVAWASSAPGVATIKAGGLASSVSPGSTTITATWVTFTPQGVAKGVTPATPIIPSPPMSPISGSTTLTVTAAAACTDSGSESLLKGQYAFSLTGFNPSGYLAVVGSFTADGTGKITAGEVDSNGALGVQTAVVIDTALSSYSVGSNHLGCATIVTSFGTFNTRLAVGSITSSVATEGRMIEWETGTSAFIATGHLVQQTASSFSGGLSGSYAFEQIGTGSKGRVGAVGVLSASGGSLTNGEMDVNEAGTASTITGMAGTYGSADSNGRFTLTITAPSTVAGTTVGYMVSSSQFLFLTLNGALAGEATQQTVPLGSFSSSSVSGNMVLYYTGLNGGGSGGKAGIGLASANGTGSFTFTGYEDDAGTWSTPNPYTVTCTYSVATNGRMTLSGGTKCGSGAPLFYLTVGNTGFMLGMGSSVGVGQFEPQTGGPFTNASISLGTFYMGTLEVVNQAVNTGVAVLTLNSSGGYSITSDYTAIYGQQADKTETGTGAFTVNSDGTLSQAGVVMGIIISSTEFELFDNVSDTYPTIQVIKQ